MSIFFSASTMGFYDEAELELFKNWPLDAIPITEEEHIQFISPTPVGKILGSNDGMPAWVDAPPPTHEESVAAAEAQKQQLIYQANVYMNSKQWPGKAAMGRLTDTERAQYSAWLDYLDELEAVNTADAPDINWRTSPES